MVDQKYRMLGVVLTVAIASSVEEFDTLAGRTGAALSEGNDNVVFRSTLTLARSKFCEKVEDGTGIERLTRDTGKKTKDAQGNEVPKLVFAETEGDYIKRVLAELAKKQGVPEVDASVLQSYADELSSGGTDEVKFDPKQREPGEAGPRAIPKRYLKAAEDQILAGGHKATWVAKHHPGKTEDQVTVEDIARKLQELTLAEERAKSAARFLS